MGTERRDRCTLFISRTKKLLKGRKFLFFLVFFFNYEILMICRSQLKGGSRVRQHVLADLVKQLDTLRQETLNGGE